MALIHFGVTLFVSAFILFLVQPLIGKFVLPKLGGTPQVWNTCMLFFQMVLLLGYGYTHFVSTKLKPRTQVILHTIVMALPFAIFVLFPFNFIRTWTPPLGSNPIFPTLFLLATVVGIPFFVVSTTAPLLQKWFGFTGHEAAKDPYFLYGASNLGSMLSLLFYPALLEPFTVLDTQAELWRYGYAALAIMVLGAVAMIWKATGAASAEKIERDRPEISTMPVSGEVLAGAIQSKPNAPKVSTGPVNAPAAPQVEKVDLWRRLRWVALAAVPSSLMLGVTYHITTDLSPIPLFWLVPLAIYLLSFILVFARWPVVWVETPHTLMVLLQPIAVILMILFEMVRLDTVWPAITMNVIGFALTTMVCHGELAKDRPSTKYLTDFYLMMSVGGVVGGLINAMLAPMLGPLFPFIWEFNVAIIAACLLRPNLPFGNWLDNLLSKSAEKPHEPQSRAKGVKAAPSIAKTETSSAPSYGIDIAVGVGVFILAFVVRMLFNPRTLSTEAQYSTLVVATVLVLLVPLLFFARGIRFGLAIAGVIFAYEIHTLSQEGSNVLHRDRTFFGQIQVKQSQRYETPYTTLIHGHIDHGMNFAKNEDPAKDMSRMATTYYHRKGPVGIVMEKFNWFKDNVNDNTFWADSRMPAGLVAQGAFGALGTGTLPFGSLVEVWTEPPYATIGLGTGTMASYARPFQHCHFYEIDDQIRRLSLPDQGRGKVYFTYLQDALDRGADVQVLMGDARQRMNLPYSNYHEAKTTPPAVPNGGPENFYHMMVVDAFSSDAIPAHLLTEEAFKMYFKHLTPDGILCVHTSNRFVDLPRVVADVAEKCGFVALRGHDQAPPTTKDPDPHGKGHYTSEWVMVAKKVPGADRANVKHLVDPPNYRSNVVAAARKEETKFRPGEPYWQVPATHNGRYLWTDDYYNLLNILRVFLPRGGD